MKKVIRERDVESDEEEEMNQSYEVVNEKVVNVKEVSFQELNIIQEQKESVCKIIKDDKSCGTGFLCIIPFPKKLNPLPVRITCYHVLSNEDIQPGKEIKLIFNDKNRKSLFIDNSRRTYSEKQYDITIIEIKEENDGININRILELDYDIYEKEDLNKGFHDKSVYIIHYPDGLNESLSINIIQKIDSKNLKIEHLCATKNGSSGAPIFNLNSFKVIGMHTGRHRNKDFNCGIILRKPIEEFNTLKKKNSSISKTSPKT